MNLGSYPDTLGFAPVAHVASVWQTAHGYKHFLSMVQGSVNSVLRDEGELPEVEASSELWKVYASALSLLRPDDNQSQLCDPPTAILEAVDYAAVLMASRVRMHRRLARMTRQSMSGQALQPRGCNGFERGELYHKDTANAEGFYAKFLEDQNALRKRFA